jgi:hypothetical protein
MYLQSEWMVRLLLGVAAVIPLVPSELKIPWSTIDSGGGQLSGGAFVCTGTIGQTDTQATILAGGEFSLSGGFWPGVVTAPPIPGDCDGDGDLDLDNYEDLAACLLGPGGGLNPDCGCFDLDEDGDVTSSDVAQFQAAFTGP